MFPWSMVREALARQMLEEALNGGSGNQARIGVGPRHSRVNRVESA